jgi:hypothetical protein
MAVQTRQNAVIFLPHFIEIFGILYLFYSALWRELSLVCPLSLSVCVCVSACVRV